MDKRISGYFQEFQVEGLGQFPYDMLRYDGAWPAKEQDSSQIAYYPGSGMTPRRVNLRRFVFQLNDQPTTARWESFGWKVVNPKSARS